MVGDRTDGTPCWLELGGPAAPELLDFYAGRLGWTYDVNEDVTGYVRAHADGAKVCGFGGPPAPAGWRVYLSVTDLDETVRKARLAGAEVAAPVDIADGRFAWLRDPIGCVTGLFASDVDPGTSTTPGPGRVSSWRLATPDAASTVRFHRRLFGEHWPRDVGVVITHGDVPGWLVGVSVPGADSPQLSLDPAGHRLLLEP